MRASHELDFRLITTAKNNFGESHISRPTAKDSLSVLLSAVYFLLRMRNAARTSAYVHYFHDMCKELGQYPANLTLRLVNNTYSYSPNLWNVIFVRSDWLL